MTLRAAVLGHPISHSKSPALHRAAYALLGVDIAYSAIDVTEAPCPLSCGRSGTRCALTVPGADSRSPCRSNPPWWRKWTRSGAWPAHSASSTPLLSNPTAGQPGWSPTTPTSPGSSTPSGTPGRPRRPRPWSSAGAAPRQLPSRPSRSSAPFLPSCSCAMSAGPARPAPPRLPWDSPSRCFPSPVRPPPSPPPTSSSPHCRPARQTGLPLNWQPSWQERCRPHAAGRPAPRHLRSPGVLLDVAYDPWPSRIAAVWQEAGGTVVPGLEMLIYQAVEQVRHFTGLGEALPAGVIDVMCDAVGAPRRVF